MKKIIKILGNVLTVIAVIYVVQRFLDMGIDYSQLKSPKIILALVIGCIFQTTIIIFGCVPWLTFIQSLSQKTIPFKSAMSVFSKSNLYKYVPGNVFQYIGRNKLASDMKISHVDVACATVLDILFNVVVTAIFSIILLQELIKGLFVEYGENIILIFIIGIVVLIIGAILAFTKFRAKFTEYLSRYTKSLSTCNRAKLLKGILYYFLQTFVFGILYFIVAKLIFETGVSNSELIIITGSFMFAWIVGFLTIGAPGGIGIRESVMIFVCGSQFESSVVIFVVVLRISSIISDCMAFAIGNIAEKRNKNG